MSLIRTLLAGLVFLWAPGIGWAATWNVDQADPGCSDSACTPCCTIQGAVVKSSGGDVISVSPGSYSEAVDFRYMASVGDITVEAASGPGTVSISSSVDEPMRHGGTYSNTVTLDGLDITAGGGYSCVYFNHMGNAVLTDVTANNCDYTAIMLDNPGTVVMERCTANSSGRTGIQIDGASSASVTDCTANSNDSVGIDVYSVGTIDIVNPTTVGDFDGIKVYAVAPTTITGATVTDNGGQGIRIESADTLAISGSTITGSMDHGIDINWAGSDPVDGVTLTNVDVFANGQVNLETGVRLREVVGPVVVTNCTFNNNGDDGFSPETSVVGDLHISGGEASGNGSDGYDLRVVGQVTVTGVAASGNTDKGIAVDSQGGVTLEDCVANDNENDAGIAINWQDPEPVDGVSVIDCTANSNGLNGGGNGIYIQHVVGAVSVVGTTTNGNSRTGVRVDSTTGPVLIRDAVSNAGLEEGIKIDIDVGPLTVRDCLADGNDLEGLKIHPEITGVESMTIERNVLTNNNGTGLAIYDFTAPVDFEATCNDIAGNVNGFYLDAGVTVDARYIWWGDPTGPSGPGTAGSGDTVYAEPGGTILFDPWLVESFTAPVSGCPFFTSDFETGMLEEWDGVVP